jgi:hypothetical protein
VIRKLWRLGAADYLLLLGAAFSVGAARLALWLLPFRIVSRLGEGRARRAGAVSFLVKPGQIIKSTLLREISPQRVAWAVMAVSRLLSGERVCLVRALAARWMLAMLGCRCELRIGVAKAPNGKFSAHAWLESEGKTVIGGTEAQSFTALPLLTAHRSRTADEP